MWIYEIYWKNERGQVKTLRPELKTQQSFFKKLFENTEGQVKTSFISSELLAKHSKYFNKEIETIQGILLSRKWVARKLIMSLLILVNILKTTWKIFNTWKTFSDLTGQAQVAVFIRVRYKNFTVTEQLLDILSLESTTTGKNILEHINELLLKYNLHVNIIYR